jgi:hypothetical protein
MLRAWRARDRYDENLRTDLALPDRDQHLPDRAGRSRPPPAARSRPASAGRATTRTPRSSPRSTCRCSSRSRTRGSRVRPRRRYDAGVYDWRWSRPCGCFRHGSARSSSCATSARSRPPRRRRSRDAARPAPVPRPRRLWTFHRARLRHAGTDWRMVPASGQPAAACCRAENGAYELHTLQVLTVTSARISHNASSRMCGCSRRSTFPERSADPVRRISGILAESEKAFLKRVSRVRTPVTVRSGTPGRMPVPASRFRHISLLRQRPRERNT